MADFWVLRKRHLNLSSLYRHPDIYSFTMGFNFRAFAAFALGIAPNLPGLAKVTGTTSVPVGATYVYCLSWLVGTTVAFCVYVILGKIWPMEDKVGEVHVSDGGDSASLDQSSVGHDAKV